MAEKKTKDIVSRGQYGSSPLGTAIFVGLRALDGFILQRALQVLDPMPGLLARFGITVPPAPSGGLPLASSDHMLTPFQAVIWAMSIGGAVKQIVWLLFTSKERMTPRAAVLISVFNTVCNSLNTLAFSLAAVNPTWSKNAMYVSIPLFAVGVAIEAVSEFQRKWFKDDPKNSGKPFAGGLFGWARSVNYMGYMIWRGAMATAAGGWVWGALVTGAFWWSFTVQSIPLLDEYCARRYGRQWEEVKKKVPYAFFPGIY